MATTFAGSTALVTGATSGIGREDRAAIRRARRRGRGTRAQRRARRQDWCSDIQNSGGKARFVAADLNDADDVRRLAAEAGPVDVLINNAGIYKFGETAETSTTRLSTNM